MSDEGTGALEYHERTSHTPRSVRRASPGLDFENKPRPYEIYESLPQVGLDEVRAPQVPALSAITASGPDGDGRSPTLETLTTLCHYSAGITKRIRRGNRETEFRAAAATGALYHVDCYLVVGPLDGLPAGVYHFDPRTRSLDVLREGDYRGVLAAASRSEAVDRAPVTVVTTSTWWRNAWKYRERTFRHAFWDSGTVLANLLSVAHAHNLRAEAVLGFADDPVAELLGVDPEREAPLELVPIGVGDSAPDALDPEPIDPETRPLSDREEEFPLIHEAWRAGTLPDGETAREWRSTAAETSLDGPETSAVPRSSPAGPEAEARIALDPVDHETQSKRPLGETIERRGSCREYEREPISFRKFSTVLDRAIRGAPIDARGGEEPLSFVEPYSIVNGVEEIPAGAYRYRPDEGELERLMAGEFREEAGHLALDQRLAADAAACVYFLADLDRLVDALGDRGYRLAQFEAAITAGRLYLATYAHRDLGGTGLTFYDDLVTDFFSPHAGGRAPMFLYTLGRPA
ncbi:SagB/ThcOx family dehydrogenase [Halalkalicoccus ordinarius]|uniref:SagB/ThcOx family dehydrogenase n=1 Tax=Halalkalicoccus ordinarius TaxID=3116651 RepID=UPI00300E9436